MAQHVQSSGQIPNPGLASLGEQRGEQKHHQGGRGHHRDEEALYTIALHSGASHASEADAVQIQAEDLEDFPKR